MKINLNFTLRNLKIISTAFVPYRGGTPKEFEMIIDPGCSMTTISPQLFKRLGHNPKDTSKIKVIGINSEESSFSTVLDSFEIGGVDLGSVRVALGQMRPEFQNSILLGMNVLMWFNLRWDIKNKDIFLSEHKLKRKIVPPDKRFSLTNPKTTAFIIDHEDLIMDETPEEFERSEVFD